MEDQAEGLAQKLIKLINMRRLCYDLPPLPEEAAHAAQKVIYALLAVSITAT